jgi:hypothetical protein
VLLETRTDNNLLWRAPSHQLFMFLWVDDILLNINPVRQKESIWLVCTDNFIVSVKKDNFIVSCLSLLNILLWPVTVQINNLWHGLDFLWQFCIVYQQIVPRTWYFTISELNSGFRPSEIAAGVALAFFRNHGALVLERDIIWQTSKHINAGVFRQRTLHHL